jgi:class 3 adenylate cyclase
MDAVDRAGLGLPKQLNLRLSGHFGPVFDIENPFTGRPGFVGTQVTRAARIEPVTPPGVVYVSEAFAAEMALSRPARHKVEYVGVTKLAKKFGDLPVFRLH